MYLFYLQDSEELFNFLPRETVSLQKPVQKNAGNENVSRKRTRTDNIVFSFIKKPIIRGTKIIRIEIYDPDNFQKSDQSTCNCEAEICVQHVVKSVLFDDIYKGTKDIINKIQDELDSK